jgi:AraC-like DNA-binding protein
MMNVPPASLLFPIQYLEICDALIRSRDGDLAAFHRQCGMSTAAMVDPLSMITGEQLLQAFTLVQTYCSTDSPASLQVLAHFPLTAHGMLGMLALASHSVGDALNAATEFFPLVMPAFKVSRMNQADQVCLVFERLCDFGNQNDFFTELVMGTLHKIMPFTLTPLERIKVTFQHRLSHDVAQYQSVLGAHIKDQDQLNSITFAKRLLHTPLITQSPTLQHMLQTSLRQRMQSASQLKPTTQQIKRLLKLFLNEHREINGDILAQQLNMSRRTLTRRLADEGHNLAQLQREVHIDHAKWLLLNSQKSIAEIALKSGFSNAANFSKTFKQMTSQTPSQFRKPH